jgi:membrane-bound lytic murein transglycosylase B
MAGRMNGLESTVFAQSRPIALAALALASIAVGSGRVEAAQCGNTSAGFETWKREFIAENRGKVSAASLDALAGTTYSTPTISADRGQHSFKLSLDQFMAKRGAATIVKRGRVLKRSQAAMFDAIEQRYGVPPGPLLAIWGMETAFGAVKGNVNTLSAVATLAYDCRRSEYFTDQLRAALTLVDRGVLSPATRGAAHGEVGHTQFLPKNVLNYGTGGDLNNASVALASTANFLKAHGWQRGQGYQPGEPNFAAIQGWNAATVYEKAIAIMGKQIDQD